MAASTFDEILLKGIKSGKAPGRTKDARTWYRNQAKRFTVAEADPKKIIREKRASATYEIRLGSMYMFRYDPKHKKTLPYYDTFPLVFPINRTEGGFQGLNMHYLPPLLRAKLMDALYTTVTNRKYDETTRIKISYEILNSVKKYREFAPTFKHYLDSQIRSRFILVEPAEWDIALFLPTARFEGADKRQVWRESKNIIAGRFK
jgi:hypothetical protein